MRHARMFVWLLASLALVSGCATAMAPAPASTALSRIQSKGELVVGTAASMPPLNMTTKAGQIVGFEPDLAKAMAEAMNVKLRLVPIPFADLLPALQSGQVDVILSGMTMTPRRNMTVAFVGPYYVSGKSFLTKSATLASAKGSADLNQASVRLAALGASTSEDFIKENLPKATLVPVKNYDEGITMLSSDKVDAMVADLPACVYTVLRYPDRGLVALVTPLTYEPIGMALPGSDPLFVNWAQNWLRQTEVTGSLAQMKDRWFSNADWLKQLP